MQPKTYHIITYGCQMNKSDSERIVSVLENMGLKNAEMDKADFVFLNLCSVRQSAIDRAWGMLRNIKNRKSNIKNANKKLKNRLPFVILTGCILKEDKKKFKDKVDLIFNINDLEKLPKLLQLTINKQQINNNKLCAKGTNYYQLREAESRVSCNKSSNNDYFHINPKYSSRFSAYVPVMTGCNNFCSYCVVPYTRGSERSRPAKEVLKEVKDLVKKGYKEITLLGQNVNSYRSKTSNSQFLISNKISNAKCQMSNVNFVNFTNLLKMVDALSGDFWIRFITSHPKDLSDDLIKAIAECEKVTEYLHLPIQSGSDKILKKMNRGYTAKQYLNLINKVRQKIRCISISTDIIVGFPGETKEDFNATADIMRKVKFDMAYIAQYSPRPGTAAFNLKDNVPKEEKRRREKVLTKILEKTALENNKKYEGRVVDVLLTGVNQYGRANGATRTFKHVKIPINKKQLTKNNNLIGQFVKVKITKANVWGLEGELYAKN